MKASRWWSLIVLASLLPAASTSAQWKNVAPGLVAGAKFGGAMQYRDGIVWAGGDNLFRSIDSGKTWQRSGNFANANITDIAFFDRLNGLVSTQAQGLFHTSDGGNSWQNVITSGAFWKVSFNGSASVMHALDLSAIFYTSVDGGVTWTRTNIGNNIECRSFAVANDGSVYVQASDNNSSPYSGTLFYSKDLGGTWTAVFGRSNGDCYTIAVDSCDPRRLYLVNEEVYQPSDNIAKIYLSTDGGGTWTITDSHSRLFYSGSLATTNDALFFGTLDSSDGIYRSVDQAQTWKPIGGPALAPDSRNIAAINANMVLGMDGNGSIWLTTNGGGDSVSMGASGFVYSESPQRLFNGDTLNLCDTPRLDTIEIDASACLWPSVKSEQVIGPAAKDYQVIQPVSLPFSTHDSAVISFVPSDTNLRLATYQLTLDDGTVISIPLAGVGLAAHQLSFAAASMSEKTDTIGGLVSVPIIVDGLARAETIELVLHYPLADLDYVGSFDPTGTKVDIPGEQWLGRSKLRITGAKDSAVAAYARFNVFSDTAYDPQITFDSLDVPTALTPCEYVPPPAETTEIIPMQGCGIPMLSRWIHLGERPVFGIRPNPTNGDIMVTASMNVGNVSIEVYDMLGTERAQFNLPLSKDAPATLSLPLESGLYYVRVISQAGASNVPVIIRR